MKHRRHSAGNAFRRYRSGSSRRLRAIATAAAITVPLVGAFTAGPGRSAPAPDLANDQVVADPTGSPNRPAAADGGPATKQPDKATKQPGKTTRKAGRAAPQARKAPPPRVADALPRPRVSDTPRPTASAPADKTRSAKKPKPSPSRSRKNTGTAAGKSKRSTPAKRTGPAWRHPMPSGGVTSCYGLRWGALHAGIDLAAPSGTPVRAVGSGRVTSAGWAYPGYGISVMVRHGKGVLTHYAHLSSTSVRVGQKVAAGQVVGREGSTGDSTGPHLHFEVHKGLWRQINPAPWLRARGIQVAC